MGFGLLTGDRRLGLTAVKPNRNAEVNGVSCRGLFEYFAATDVTMTRYGIAKLQLIHSSQVASLLGT